MNEKRISQLMKSLEISREEAIQVIKDDEAIDKGAKLFELTAEQKQVEKKARQADRNPTVYQFQKKERKANDNKRFLIEALQQGIVENCGSIPMETTNIEREFIFHFNGTKYKVVLSAPRS